MSAPRRPAVFLDRDGTLDTELDFLVDPDELRLYPGAARAVRAFNERGIPVVVVTNQSAIARGLLDEEGLARVHERLAERLAEEGAHLDLVLACPHHPHEGSPPWRRVCGCRKPAPGMLVEAARRLGLDLAASWTIGDAARDLEAGRRAGTRSILVLTGKGPGELARLEAQGRPPRWVARDLLHAAELVLRLSAAPGEAAGAAAQPSTRSTV